MTIRKIPTCRSNRHSTFSLNLVRLIVPDRPVEVPFPPRLGVVDCAGGVVALPLLAAGGIVEELLPVPGGGGGGGGGGVGGGGRAPGGGEGRGEGGGDRRLPTGGPPAPPATTGENRDQHNHQADADAHGSSSIGACRHLGDFDIADLVVY